MGALAMDGREVGMAGRSEGLGLPLKALKTISVLNETVGQHVDRQVMSQPCLAGPIYLTHPADAKGCQDLT